MTLLSYQIFQTVVEQGSFQKAAQVLNLTPSAISHSISTMEKELGFPLFNRNKNGITLTSYGENLQPYILTVLNSDAKLQQAISEFNGLTHGSVKIGSFSSVCTSFIPDIVTQFSAAHPNIEIKIYQGTYDDVYNWLKTGVVDIGFLSESSCKELKLTPIYQDELFVITPKSYQSKHTNDVYGQNRSNAMEKMIRELIGDRLLELSRYVTLDSVSKTMHVDESSLKNDGYQVMIH